MDKSDLSAFFKSEVPTAQPGDDQINAFKGAPYTAGTSGEADLDTQFIMGVAPGIKTDFYEIPSQDFCADLKNYTDMLIASAGSGTPFVNSVSYGWQGSLSKVGCAAGEAQAV